MLLPDVSEGHTQHDPQREATADLHLGQPANRVECTAEGDVEATRDPFDRLPVGIFTFPGCRGCDQSGSTRGDPCPRESGYLGRRGRSLRHHT
jgi:hypothetical protein